MKLSINKAIILMMFPTIVSAVLYLCYRLLLEGVPASQNSYVAIINNYVLLILYVVPIVYGFKKYHFSLYTEGNNLEVKDYLLVVLIVICLFLIWPLLQNLDLFFIDSISSINIYAPYKIEEIMGVIVIAPIVEEIFYKNILYKLTEKYSVSLTILVVSVFFTLPHLDLYNWHSFLSYFSYSVISCIVFLKVKSLVICVFFHFLLNSLFSLSLFYNIFMFYNIYTQTWYLFVIIFAAGVIYYSLQKLKK